MHVRQIRTLAIVLAALVLSTPAQAFVIAFDDDDFTTTPVFGTAEVFRFMIDVAGPVAPGVYSNPTLNGVVYSVFGGLESGTPSGFPGFALNRTIGGAEFYLQGSSLSFEITAGADLSDGLQAAELAGGTLVFELNAREVGTGRYHPPLLALNADGTGSIRNSNNTGGINPSTMEEVDVDLGEEYITDLTFDPETLTLVAIPLPGALLLFVSALGGIVRARKFGRG